MNANWNTKKISEVVKDFHQGLNTAGQKIKFFDEGYPIIQTRNLDKGIIDLGDKIKFMSVVDWNMYKHKYKPSLGDVFLTNIGTIGKTAVVTKEEDYLIHWNIFIFKLDEKVLLPFYLKYFLDCPSSFDYYNSFQKGGTVSFITKKIIANMDIPIPPLSEQNQIVEILDRAFGAIDQAKANIGKNIENAKELFQSKLNEIFSQKGEGWEEKKLKEITTKIGSGATPRGGQASYKESGISLIRSMNVHDKGFRKRNLAFIDDEQAKKLDNVTILENDVLLNITGASVARCCVVDNKFLPARVNQHVSIIRLKEGVMNYKFLHYTLTSHSNKKLLLGIGEQGATRQAITKVQIENFQVKFPLNIEEQDKLVLTLDNAKLKIHKLEEAYKTKIKYLDELKKSILQKAFAGELTGKELPLKRNEYISNY